MRVGLLADTHDRLPAMRELIAQMQAGGVQLVMHAGDYCAPFSLQVVIDAQVALLGVFGRNDGDREGLKANAQKGVGIELYEAPHSFEVGGKRILLVHDLADVSQRSLDAHQIVIYGHSHLQEMQHQGETLLVNPGEGCGWLYGTPSGAILDLDTRQLEVIRLTGPEWSH